MVPPGQIAVGCDGVPVGRAAFQPEKSASPSNFSIPRVFNVPDRCTLAWRRPRNARTPLTIPGA